MDTAPDTSSTPAPAWHEALVMKGADGSERLSDPAQWLDKAPAPLADFIRANMSAARARTDGMVRIPGADARPEDVAAFHKALGVPETADGYDLSPPKEVPEGITFDPRAARAFAEFARQQGLTPAQVSAIKNYQVQRVGEEAARQRETAQAQLQQSLMQEKAELATRFGDRLDSTLALVRSLENRRGIPESLRTVIRGGGFDPAHPGFWGVDALEAVAYFARATGEDGSAGAVRSGGNAGNTPGYWKAVMADKDHPDHKRLSSHDADAVRRFNEAYRMAGQ